MSHDLDTDTADGTYVIVIATDLSPASTPALAEALRLASAVRDPVLHFVHAAPAGTTRAVLVEMKKRMIRELEARAAELDLPVPRNHLVHVEAGSPKEVVLGIAHDAGADLLVLGTRFDSQEERARFDSVSEELLHAAPCSVLVVNGRRAAKDRRG